jgi:DNA-binding GntR family transcriptional regulator
MEFNKENHDKGLSPAIAEELKRLIYSGEIAPGDRLNEVSLATRMGTSRGPIREAIRILTGLGLVTAVPNRGVFVRQASVRDMLENYELRTLLFGYAAEQACEHIDEEGQAKLEDFLKKMNEACEAGDGSAYYEINLHFHTLILHLSGNQRLHQTYDDLVKEMHVFRRGFFNSPSNMRRSNEEHRAIFEAITKGETRRAKTLAERHVQSGRTRVLARLER